MDISGIIKTANEETREVRNAPGVKIRFRDVRPVEMRKVRSDAWVTKKDGPDQFRQEMDIGRFNDGLNMAVIIGWEGIENGGQPFECNDENKRLLLDSWPEFVDAVDGFVADMLQRHKAHRESAIKN